MAEHKPDATLGIGLKNSARLDCLFIPVDRKVIEEPGTIFIKQHEMLFRTFRVSQTKMN